MCRALAIVALSVTCPRVARATTVIYRTDGELVALSQRVVHARVLSSTSTADAIGIVTVTRLAILEDLTGVGSGVIEVREPGGEIAGRGLWVPGAPRFVEGEEVVLCLERARGAWRTVALSFSAFHVRSDGGAARLERFHGELSVAGGGAAALSPRSLDEFRRVVAAVKGVRPVRGEPAAAEPPAAPPGRVDQNFTLLGGGVRWRQADADTPVVWYRSTAAPSPLASGDTDAEIRVALSAWTNVETARIVLAFGGTRSDGGAAAAGIYCSTVNEGAGLITFGNVGNVVPSGALAIGGGCFDAADMHVVNGQAFRRLTHGYVVFNHVSGSFTATPDFTRVVQHEIGHGIGLGHTCVGTCPSDQQINIMYPSCCVGSTPLPPALGPDDRAGVAFIYPEPATPGTCSFVLTPSSVSFPVAGGASSVAIAASAQTCAWTAAPNGSWVRVVGASSGTGDGTVAFTGAPNFDGQPRSTSLSVAGAVVNVSQAGDSDIDGDGLSDGWESQFGLNPQSAAGSDGAQGDPDGDGSTNADERFRGSHPRGFVTRYLPEGAVNAFFETQFAVLNPGTAPARTLLRLSPGTGAPASLFVDVPAQARRTVTSDLLATLLDVPFATRIESDELVVVDRTMHWGDGGYGSHAASAVASPSTTWYFAEGSTSGDFALFYLLQNVGTDEAEVSVRFLRPAPLAPIAIGYRVPAGQRLTIPVDTAAAALASTDVSAVITSTQPIVAERAMYLSQPGQPFAAGHGSAGVPAPATEWFLAEGATGSFFELFLLIANPGATPADVQVDYLRANGTVLRKTYSVGAASRFTIWVDEEQFPAGSGQRLLASEAVSMRVRSIGGVPIIVDRSMWWPQPTWYEAHNEVGATATGTRWALAEGEAGGAAAVQTYVLVANTSATAGLAEVTLYFEDATTEVRTVPIPAQSRTNVPIGVLFPSAVNRRFGMTVQSVASTPGGVPPQIVVERAMYSDQNGLVWSAGTAALGTRLSP